MRSPELTQALDAIASEVATQCGRESEAAACVRGLLAAVRRELARMELAHEETLHLAAEHVVRLRLERDEARARVSP